MTPLERVMKLLPEAKPCGDGWKVCCPAHDDRNPSLSVREGKDGRVLLHCFGNCKPEAIVAKLNLTMRDLMPCNEHTHDVRISDVDRGGKKPPGRMPAKEGPTFPTADEAVRFLERRLGERSSTWEYRDDAGGLVGLVVRWDRADSQKTIRPISRNGAKWAVRAMSVPRPLYCLPEIAKARRVYVCEGEKAADALRALGLTGTTSPHGSKSAAKADWSPLSGKECVLVPDNDDAGRAYVNEVTSLLELPSPSPTIKILELPDMHQSGDAADYVAVRRAFGLDDDNIRTEIEAMADAAEPLELAPSTPTVERYIQFPVDTLPDPVRNFVVESARAIGCDSAYLALPMLSTLAGAIGNTRCIELKRGWTEPAIIWTAIVGESGTLKTPALKKVMENAHAHQSRAFAQYTLDCEQYQAEELDHQKNLASWRRDPSVVDGPPHEPSPPIATRFIVSDTTIEAIVPILLDNLRGLLVVRDELAGWIGSFDRYASGKAGSDAAHWLSMHSAESITIDRKTGPSRTIHIPLASVSVTGGIQPGILNRAMGYSHRESGMFARFLLAAPPRRSKRWSEIELPPDVDTAVSALFGRLYEIDLEFDQNGKPRPVILRMTRVAKQHWVQFYDQHGREQIDLSGDLASAWSKLEGYAARLALVIHCIRQAADDPTLRDPNLIDECSILAGIRLSRWFGREARRVYHLLGESEEECHRRQLVELIERKDGSVSPRDLMRSSRKYSTAEEAETALQGLVKAGLGKWQFDDPQTRRGHPARRFVLDDYVDVDTSRIEPEKKGTCVNVNVDTDHPDESEGAKNDNKVSCDVLDPPPSWKISTVGDSSAPSSSRALSPLDLPAEWYELFQERAAIREFDGGQDRQLAEAEALREVLGKIQAA